MPSIPIKQRLGLGENVPVEKDFPQWARIALSYVLDRMCEKGMLHATDLIPEVLRTARLPPVSFGSRDILLPILVPLLEEMRWDRIFTLCERLYELHITEVGYMYDEEDWIVTLTKEQALTHYADELNQILIEENIGYHFVDGLFQRRGRAQTQQAIQRVGKVLSQPRLSGTRKFYSRARKFFDQRPEPDSANCVKEALCALEAGLEALTGKPAGKDFVKVVKQLQGNDPEQIPSPIAEGMIKLHGYRGSGDGVAHGSSNGARVDKLEAELVLSLVATYITYLVDLFPEKDDFPF